MAQVEEESDTERPLAVVEQLAGGVIDGRDVIGVEGVTHPERVGQHTGPHPEELGLADVIVAAEGSGHHRPAHDIEPDHDGRHAAHARPLAGRQAVANLGEAGTWVGHRSGSPWDLRLRSAAL